MLVEFQCDYGETCQSRAAAKERECYAARSTWYAARCTIRKQQTYQKTRFEFINLFAVITFTVQVVTVHNEKISTHLQVLNVLNFKDRRKEDR